MLTANALTKLRIPNTNGFLCTDHLRTLVCWEMRSSSKGFGNPTIYNLPVGSGWRPIAMEFEMR
jgi:hypothetical protein